MDLLQYGGQITLGLWACVISGKLLALKLEFESCLTFTSYGTSEKNTLVPRFIVS